jgi:rod shape-determining protein MreB
MPRNTYGLDLGTHEIKVYDKKNQNLWKQKNVIALKEKDKLVAIGDKAYEMVGKTPSFIRVVHPMKKGAIAHFDNMQHLLSTLINNEGLFLKGSEYLVAVPTDVTEIEKRAFYDLVLNSPSKVKGVRIVERSMADAIGAKIDVFDTKGTVIVNLGGSTTELSVLLSGGMVVNRLLKVGGEDFDTSISNLIRRTHDVMIGHSAAEHLRNEFGVASLESQEETLITGKNILSGFPQRIEVSSSLVGMAMREELLGIVQGIKAIIDRTPADVQQEIYKNGIHLVGGLARVKGLSEYIKSYINIPIHLAAEPELASIRGLETIIINRKVYNKFTYSMLDEDYRWLR